MIGSEFKKFTEIIAQKLPEMNPADFFISNDAVVLRENGFVRVAIKPGEKVLDYYGWPMSKKEIIECIKTNTIDYYGIMDAIEEDKDIRDLIFSKLNSLEPSIRTEKHYKELFDKINSMRMKEQKQSPLQQRDSELTSLEAEEKTIAEAEALIDKQAEKAGEQK